MVAPSIFYIQPIDVSWSPVVSCWKFLRLLNQVFKIQDPTLSKTLLSVCWTLCWSLDYLNFMYWSLAPTSVILPDAHTWLSFNITIPLKSCLCMDTPPTNMAYFSTRRKPGVVLRVPATSPCQPCAFAIAWSWEQRVAMPDARARQLRAGRSPRRREFAGPLTTAVRVTASSPVDKSR